MNIGFDYKLILAIVPFASVIFGAYLTGMIPERSAISKVMEVLAEEDLQVLMKNNGFSAMSVAIYQIIRVLVSILISLSTPFVFGIKGKGSIGIILISLFAMYKFFYVYLRIKDNQRIKRLNMVLPYTIKSIAYLANVYPVNNALLKAIDIVPKEFTYDLRQLCDDIDADPASFAPYQKFIDRYDGRLNRLDYYLKTLYRMSMSASKEEVKLLTNLNETISEEMSTARKSKNEAVNSTVTWLGLIPVGLLTVMLLFLMVEISLSI